jgi:predicted small metal-binding protein
MATKQYRKLGCLQVNPTGGCAFEVQAETEDEVMRLTGEHARAAHNMTSIPPETASKLRSMIQAVTVNV